MSAVVDFLSGDGRDAAGRTFEAVLRFDDGALERHHDFIQWLFPLAEASQAVPDSPVLDEAATCRLRASPTARDRQARATARMLAFYEATTRWRDAVDHNHLRITRIIKSLRLLSGDGAAEAFHQAILVLGENTPISPRTRRYWADA